MHIFFILQHNYWISFSLRRQRVIWDDCLTLWRKDYRNCSMMCRVMWWDAFVDLMSSEHVLGWVLGSAASYHSSCL